MAYGLGTGSDLTSLYNYGLNNGTLSNLGMSLPTQTQLADVSGTGTSGLASALSGYNAGTGNAANGLFGLSLKDTIGAGLSGLSTIGGLVGSLGSLSLANKQYDLQKQAYTTNLANSVQAYNTSLEDKARSRGVVEGQSDSQVQAYIDAHKATTGS